MHIVVVANGFLDLVLLLMLPPEVVWIDACRFWWEIIAVVKHAACRALALAVAINRLLADHMLALVL